MKSQYGRTKSVRSQQYRSLNCSNKKLTNQTQSQKFKWKFMKQRVVQVPAGRSVAIDRKENEEINVVDRGNYVYISKC